jgi:hypothetical protein
MKARAKKSAKAASAKRAAAGKARKKSSAKKSARGKSLRVERSGKPRRSDLKNLFGLHPLKLALDPNWVRVVAQHAAASPIARYSWRDRGRPKIGYIKGMAVVFGQMYLRLKANDPIVREMSRPAGDARYDALAWYNDVFVALGMDNRTFGVDTLRHLFVFLMGLGMRESSGKYCEGRDRSANNTTAETAEAGLFQTSFNARSMHPYLPQIFANYSANPIGYREIFEERVVCRPEDWEIFGTGPGAAFQQLSKTCPAFAVEFAAIGIRSRRSHWGPITNRHVEIMPDADRMYRDIQAIIDGSFFSPAFS